MELQKGDKFKFVRVEGLKDFPSHFYEREYTVYKVSSEYIYTDDDIGYYKERCVKVGGFKDFEAEDIGCLLI